MSPAELAKVVKLSAYRREVVVAEKFHAMVTLGLANSRMKDYFDTASFFASSTGKCTVVDRVFTPSVLRTRGLCKVPSPVVGSSRARGLVALRARGR